VIPLGDNSTDKHIPPTANKVRVETKHTFLDYIINRAEIYEVK
jgi:hypothetical protein